MRLEMTLPAFHRMVQDGVDRMIQMGRRFNIALNTYQERQLVHEIGYGLRQRRHWVAFEQRYPGPNSLSKRTVADILAFSPAGIRSGGEHLWIEVKSTGLTHDLRWNNNLSTLGWKRDFEKLSSLDNRLWNSRHYGYWVWL